MKTNFSQSVVYLTTKRLLALVFILSSFSNAQVIDFETMGGFPATDDAVVSDQFRAAHGVRFRLDTTGNGLPDAKLLRIEAAGSDGTDGFVGVFGNDRVGLAESNRLGDFFLRSHLSRNAGATAPLSLIILYDTPVSAASAEIWDIDGFATTEQWQIDAMGADYVNSNDKTDVVDSLLSPIGNTSLLNAKPWIFSFDHHGTTDIHALRIRSVGSKTDSIGFGFDNFSPSAPAAAVDNCAPGLPPMRSTKYNNTNANIVPFAHEPQFNATIKTTIEAWVYREGPAIRVETIVSQDLDSRLCFGFFPNLRFYRSGGSPATVPVTVPAKRWTHVAVSYNGSTARFYLDGVLAGERSLSNSGTGGAQRLFLGGEASGLPFLGCLDEVRIWSLVRTEAQIRNGMHREIRSAPGLTAVFPEGGMNEALAGLRGNPTPEPEKKVWGMIPNNLVMPRVDSINFDGEPLLATQYAGAEEMPIRYADGPDGHAWLVYTDNEGESDDKLYVGLTNLREPSNGSNRAVSKLAVYLDSGRTKGDVVGAQDFRFQMSMAADAQAETGFIGNGRGSWRGINGGDFNEVLLAGSYRIKSDIPGNDEFAPLVYEYQINKPLFGNFESPAGFAISQTNAEHFFDIDLAPSFAHPTSPKTWSCLTFGDAVDRPTVLVDLGVGVRNGIDGAYLTSYEVNIFDAGTNEVLAEFRTTPWNGGGTYVSPLTLPANRPLRIQIPGCNSCRYEDPIVSSSGIQPTSTNSLEAYFAGIPEGSDARLARVIFHVELPLPPIEFTSIEESSALAPIVMRTSPDVKIVPELSTITLHCENFHPRLEVYLHDCLNIVPLEGVCREGIDLILCEVLSISPDRTTMEVKLPPARTGRWQVAIKDNWTRPGVLLSSERWFLQGPLTLTLDLNYAQLYGFEFENEPDKRELDGRSWPLFTSVFQNSAYSPLAACTPDPMYLLYYGVFSIVDRTINGTCVGFASSSRLFLHGDLDSNDFGAPYPYDLPGVSRTIDGRQFWAAPQPDRYSWRGPCLGHRPNNLWANLRRNHMVQL